jgi:hypothetical protein
MSETYFFYESGSIPNVPGLFAGVRVDVSDEGEVTTTPLAKHLAFEPEESEAVRPEMEAEDVPAEQTPLTEDTPEQPASPETVYHTEPSSPTDEVASSSEE